MSETVPVLLRSAEPRLLFDRGCDPRSLQTPKIGEVICDAEGEAVVSRSEPARRQHGRTPRSHFVE
jgi:hypothetical protein